MGAPHRRQGLSGRTRALADPILLLLYGESLMVALHLWILGGIFLPDLEDMRLVQTPVMKFGYLLSDALLPILSATFVASRGAGPPPLAILCCICIHTILYAAFAWDESSMDGVMGWAYSGWSERLVLPVGPGAAVILDATCHGWCLISLLQHTEGNNPANWMACSAGIAVGACTMSLLAGGSMMPDR